MTDGIHTHYSAGYKVWDKEAEIRYRGGSTIIWRKEARWQVEGVTSFGPNVVSLKITVGRKRYNVVG